jgi:hypothetical protein
MFKRVTADVLGRTHGKQQPERLSRLQNELFLLSIEHTNTPQPDEVAWSFLKDTREPEQLRRFIAHYPGSLRRREAGRRGSRRSSKRTWR